MLKKWICILVCGSFLLSCSDRSYRGDADTEEFVYEPLPVMVVVGDPENLFTKGSGAIDADSDTWGGAPFYVYFNIDSARHLRKILSDPRKYAPSGIYILRIHGTFVNFLDLAPVIQEDIIKRLERRECA